MLTFKKVFEIFKDYLDIDEQLEVVPTKHGLAVMLWDDVGHDWSDVVCCDNPEALFDKLLDSAMLYYVYRLRMKSGVDLTDEELAQVEKARADYLLKRG